jgi:hypothetical protein
MTALKRAKRPPNLDRPALPPPAAPTRAELAEELRIVAGIMHRTGTRLAYYGGFGEIGAHGREMIGAAKIAKSWVREIRRRKP